MVFPTETVYGLGADARRDEAVAAIFAAKGRPADNPLIVHVADIATARSLAAEWPEVAERLAAKFWPGPLALVVRAKSGAVSRLVSAGLTTIALRVPDSPLALALLSAADMPLAAPSANTSGRPSPTRVSDARDDLGTRAACYLDGGATRVGIESTVLDLTTEPPTVLREGGVPREALEAALGTSLPAPTGHAAEAPRAPGMKYRHYAPRARVHLVAPGEGDAALEDLRDTGAKAALLSRAPSLDPDTRCPGTTAEAWAHNLFALLRDLDKQGYGHIIVEEPPSDGVGVAVLERLRKAAAA